MVGTGCLVSNLVTCALHPFVYLTSKLVDVQNLDNAEKKPSQWTEKSNFFACS